MTPQKRKRSQNFTPQEKEKLVKILMNYKEIILNKKTDSATNKAKNEAWAEVTNKFNAVSPSLIHRSRESLIKSWDKIKSDTKLYYDNIKKGSPQTEGEESTTKPDPVLEMVCSILGLERRKGVKRELESETIEIYPKISNDNESGSADTDDELDDSGSEDEDESENEHNGSANIRKKRQTIEDLKKTLLLEEIQFKRKLYKLQLQAAAKDVEIKEEMFKQIKCKEVDITDGSEQ